MIAADRPVAAAGIFTLNQAKAAPVLVSQEHLAWSAGQAQVVVTNSGCANACTGVKGCLMRERWPCSPRAVSVVRRRTRWLRPPV